MQTPINHSAVLFSGGSDSTLAAALEAEAGQIVHLLTFDRVSFIGAKDYTLKNFNNLRRVYGTRIKTHEVIKIDQLHKKVCYSNYFSMLYRFGLATTSLCFSKIAMHWAAAHYCRQHNIHRIVDGSVSYMSMYPDQNRNIAHNHLKNFYAKLGIVYDTPIFAIADKAEEMLYDRGIITVPNVRGTDQDFQVYYLEQVLLALFLKFYLNHNSQAEYENVLSEIYENRLSYILKSDFNHV